MKKAILAAAVLFSLNAFGTVSAGEHTVTLGYAQSDVQDFDDIDGINVKYRYEWDSPLSLIASFTYMSGDVSNEYRLDYDAVKNKGDIDYYSLGVGPAYRINDMFSIYGLVGFNVNDVSYSSTWYNNVYYSGTPDYVGKVSGSETKTSFMYGAGVQINPMPNLTIDAGYEGSQLDVDGKSYSINGFNVGVGYRF